MASYPTPPPSNPATADMTYYGPPYAPKLPAQESYFHDTGPPSPRPDTHGAAYPPKPNGGRISPPPTWGSAYQKPNGRISPSHHGKPQSPKPGVHAAGRPAMPGAFRPNSPYRRTPSPPFMYPPGRTPSPFAVGGKPKPRPGFIARVEAKLTQWIRTFMRWSKKHPIKAGLMTFIPLLGWVCVRRLLRLINFSLVGKIGLGLGGAIIEGLGGKKEAERNRERGMKGGHKKWGWGLDHFVGFGGSKDMSPIGGMLKLLHMFVNHYCKLSPSAVPRTASMLLELYFLEEIRKDFNL